MSIIDTQNLVSASKASPKICMVTLGCAKNEVDSANMITNLQNAGFQLCDDPEDADAVIVNTCAFIQAATEESLQTIFEISSYEGFSDGSKKIIAAGCLPARYEGQIEDELSEASAFVPCSKEDDIVAVLRTVLNVGDSDLQASDDEAEYVSPWAASPAAYVKIAEGCNRFCAFCAIPYIRGRYHSHTLEQVRADVQQRIDCGVREITLIAQDTGLWGSDFDEPSSTAQLLAILAEEHPDTWFRLMYIEPDGVTDELLEAIAAHDNICSYLDVPLQHASAPILSAMNRKGSYDENVALVQRIRDKVPGITLRTTLIAGFPGETEEDFEELLDMIDEIQLDYVGVFPYSPEEGTRAATLPEQVDEETKVERTQAVRDLADSISHARVAQRIGQTMDVLVLGYEEDGQLYGRAMCQAPDVDGVVYLESGEPGDIVSVTITDTLLYEMEGE